MLPDDTFGRPHPPCTPRSACCSCRQPGGRPSSCLLEGGLPGAHHRPMDILQSEVLPHCGLATDNFLTNFCFGLDIVVLPAENVVLRGCCFFNYFLDNCLVPVRAHPPLLSCAGKHEELSPSLQPGSKPSNHAATLGRNRLRRDLGWRGIHGELMLDGVGRGGEIDDAQLLGVCDGPKAPWRWVVWFPTACEVAWRLVTFGRCISMATMRQLPSTRGDTTPCLPLVVCFQV
jgi:hypothetical protein